MNILDYVMANPNTNIARQYGVQPVNVNTDMTFRDLGLLGLSMTPVIGDAMAAKEAYDELSKANPNYLAGGLLAGAALAGAVPLVGDVAAQPLRAAGRKVAQRLNQRGEMPTVYSNPILARKPKPPTKEELDPLGYQKTKMRDYLSNTVVKAKDLKEKTSKVPRTWEEMEGKLVIPFYGDRTSGGLLVQGVDDVKFKKPVRTEGGVDFKRMKANQEQRAIWASNSNIVKRLADESDKAREAFGGRDVYGMTGSMAPDANDFATFTGEIFAELVDPSKITKKAKKIFDKNMRLKDPTFVGLDSPKLRDWVAKASPENRKTFIRLADSNPMQAAGMPSPAQARYAATDIIQRDLGAGMFGLGVSKVDELSPILRKDPVGNNPAIMYPHSTYNTQLTGDYFGSLPPVPQSLIFRDVYDAMEGKVTKAGQPFNEAHRTHAIKTKVPVQEIRPEILDGILDYLAKKDR